MTPEKGNIAATTPESQDHHGFNVDDSLEANPSQANPSKLTLAPCYANAQSRVMNSQLYDHNANLRINAAATIIQKNAAAQNDSNKRYFTPKDEKVPVLLNA